MEGRNGVKEISDKRPHNLVTNSMWKVREREVDVQVSDLGNRA